MQCLGTDNIWMALARAEAESDVPRFFWLAFSGTKRVVPIQNYD